MKIVQCNRFNSSLDNAYSSRSCYRLCEVKMLKAFIAILISVGGAYYYGYFEGQTKAREEIFGENVKKVDRKRRRH